MAILAFMPAPAGAAIHDRDCMFPASPFSDAANFWTIATVLIDFDCTGEVRPGNNDSDDWYKMPAPVLGGGDRSVRVCPLSAGLNTDLELFLRPAVGLPAIGQLPPGLPLGASSLPAGCDSASVPALLNSAGADVYIHVHATGGAGLYRMIVA